MRAMDVSASALTAERTRLEVVSANLANSETTRTAEGGPYRPREVFFVAGPVGEAKAGSDPDRAIEGVREVRVEIPDRPPLLRYQPGHPDADARGYVSYPDINKVAETVNLMEASRSYEANVTVVRAVRAMLASALNILR
ncbi:MAG TPA: flagellar basal body rod protein FlgC [Verrucomicrobiae bacterium]|nr:flagellar basal body rod protein FlgC [Verrucomicrobiae bacterium]